MGLRMERVKPEPGQESVWDYPRPPRTEPTSQRIRVELGGVTIADSTRAVRILETSSPPVYYWSIWVGNQVAENAAWSYQNPTPGYESIQGYLAFYAGRIDACYVGDERVEPQPGSFYGGWITSQIVGPFKGTPGTEDW